MAKKKITPEQIAGLGLVGIIGYFLLTNGSKMIDAISGGGSGTYSGYSGSGTDLSAIPEGFFTETPPVFNITNTPPNSFFSTPSLSDGESKKDVSVATLNETDITPNNVNWSSTGASWITDNPISNFINSMKPANWGQDLSKDQYTKMSNDYSSLSIFKNENVKNGAKSLGGFLASAITPFPLNLLFNLGSVSAGCSGGTCKKDYNTTPAEIPFNIDLTTPNLNKPLVYGGNNTETAGVYIASLRSQNKTNGLSVWGDNPVLTRTGENTYLVTNSQNLGKYYDYSKKTYVTDFSNVERAIQSDQALKLAGGNCGSAVATNQCTGVKKTVSYGNTPSSTTRYYENTGTSLTRKDLRLGD